MTARLTVAIPFFDESLRLGDAVRSVLAQTVRDFDLLLVDDGSTDDSVAIARSFRDPRIQVVADGERRGLPARLNQINRMARTELVARMDADDMMHPTRLARQLGRFDEDARCDIVGTRVIFVDERDEPFAVSRAPRLPPTPASVLLGGVFAHPSILGRRRVFLDHPYDERYTRSEDRELWCRIAQKVRFALVDEPLHVMRVCASDDDFLVGYRTSQKQNREILARFGPEAVGIGRTAALRLASMGKEGIMTALVRARVSRRVLRRRGTEPTASDRERLAETLAVAQRP